MVSRSFGEDTAQSGSSVSNAELPRAGSEDCRIEAEALATASVEGRTRILFEPRFALLIGNERYAGNRLETPVADVRMLADLLASLGFTVHKIENGDRGVMHEALAAFAACLDEAGRDAVAFVYFAGHGFQDEGINYLVPVSTELPSRAYLKARTLAVDDIVQALAATARKANVIVLDACRKSPLAVQPRTRDVTEGLADLKLPPEVTILVAYSTSAGSVAADDLSMVGADGRRHSPYATALQQALPGLLEPNRRIHDVFVEAAERVKRTTNGTQSPALYLQGVAPPLNATDADRERFKTWVRRRRTWRESGLQVFGAATLMTLAIIAGSSWFMSYPETRSQWLAQSGLRKSPTFEWSCRTSGSRIDRFLDWSRACNACDENADLKDRLGLTVRQWCDLPVHDVVQVLKRENRWDWDREYERAQAGDVISMTLIAAEFDFATENLDPALISEGRRWRQAWAMRAARAGWMPAWPVMQQLNFGDDVNRTEPSPEILAGLLQARNLGIEPAKAALTGKPYFAE